MLLNLLLLLLGQHRCVVVDDALLMAGFIFNGFIDFDRFEIQRLLDNLVSVHVLRAVGRVGHDVADVHVLA